MLVDTATVYYRAYYSQPDTLVAPDGRPVNALRGSLEALTHFVARYQPDRLITAWDNSWRPDWRVDLIESYKTARVADDPAEQMPDTLSDQVDLLRIALTELGVPCVGVDEYESDDVIAQYARTASEPVYIVTGDRDLFQLVDDERNVQILYLGTGVSRHTVCDNAFIETKYGIKSSQYGEFALLRGDASDGLPGVKGVGEKTAAALLQEHLHIDGILAAAAAGNLRPKLAENLLAHADYIDRARQVVLLHHELPVPDIDLSWRPAGTSPLLAELGLHRHERAWQTATDY